jgi:hypothetical protein
MSSDFAVFIRFRLRKASAATDSLCGGAELASSALHVRDALISIQLR